MRLRPMALLVGLLIASPAIWRALVEGTLSVDVALQRTLVALLVASVGAAVFEAVVRPYVSARGSALPQVLAGGPQRRADDLPAPRVPMGDGVITDGQAVPRQGEGQGERRAAGPGAGGVR